jgi:two-component system osmolarity sensor histidine kinase EnvZ
MIYVNGIPATIGNFLTGAFILPISYKISRQVSLKKDLDKARIENQILHRTDMLAHISHDLRTPLTRLKLQVAIIKKQELVRDMDKNLDEMDNLIRGYLNFAKEEGNELSTRFDLMTLAKESVRLINDPRLAIKSNTESIIVNLKKDAIKRVLKNLITNAQKYCTSKIILGMYKKSSENFIITIDDDGPGINPKDYQQAFKPFNKLNSDKEGFGLGLSIIKSIILSHGGNIKLAKSELGGLRVIIRIPL